MGLKQDVVIVNEFSVPLPGGKGSRGATPGDYVTRYMARDGATESLAPIRRERADDFILRYMAREEAVEREQTDRPRIKADMRSAQREGGLAFGYGSASLPDDALRAAAADIQRCFESGRTVMKTVLSFDQEYLRKHGIIDPDFSCQERGDYRGHIDQMKLRLAIMNGMDRMAAGSGGFDDLRWIGTIQVDTMHVHCHIAAVDAGRGRMAKDGTQRGKLTEAHRSRLRRGVDSWLDEHQMVARLSSAVGYERRNVQTYIKRWALEKVKDESLPQFLVACLPDDRSLWRAGSNDRRMRMANSVAAELVEEQLARPGSPMPAAMERVVAYADHRRENEDLDRRAWQRLVDQGRSRIVERAVNGVYGLLRALPPEALSVRTPMLDVMSMDYTELAGRVADGGSRDDVVAMGYRLRGYGSRLAGHRAEAAEYHDLIERWDRADAAGAAAPESRVLREQWAVEEEWHRLLVGKYRHFLPFAGDDSVWADRGQELADYGSRLIDLRAMRSDASLARMKDGAEAERLGREIYGQSGGRRLTQGKAGRAALDSRIAAMEESYGEKADELRREMADAGLVLEIAEHDGTVDISSRPGESVDFDGAKGLDLHHLVYDFPADVPVGPRTARSFVEASRRRRKALIAAMDYLEATGQQASIADLPVDDVAAMSRLASRIGTEAEPVLPSRIAELRTAAEEARERRSPAPTLDAGLALVVRRRVDDAALLPATDGMEEGSFDDIERG